MAARNYLHAVEDESGVADASVFLERLGQAAAFWAQTEVIHLHANKITGLLTEVLCDPDVHLGEDK